MVTGNNKDFLIKSKKPSVLPRLKSRGLLGFLDAQEFYSILKYGVLRRILDIKRIQNFNLILCRMQKRKVNGVTIYEIKEDDIHLAVDMVKLAYKDAYDIAILVSTDGDFVPAVEAVREKGKLVESIGFENKFSWHLKQKSNIFRKITKKELSLFFN